MWGRSSSRVVFVGILLCGCARGAAVERVSAPVEERLLPPPEAPLASATSTAAPTTFAKVEPPKEEDAPPPPPEVVVPEPPLTPEQEKAAQLFATASADYRQWSAAAGDTGANRDKRNAAVKALTAYYQANRTNASAARQVVEAAYAIGMMKKSVGDATYRMWLRNTVSAWDDYRAKAPLRGTKSAAQYSPYVDFAAEADFILLDEQITANHDTPARHTYGPTLVDVFGSPEINPSTQRVVLGGDGKPKMKAHGKYESNAAETTKWDQELEKLTRKYDSREWFAVVVERQGSLFDKLRTGLANITTIIVLTPSEQAMLAQMRASGRPDVIQLANELERAKNDFWRQKKELELDGCDKVMVRRYATAIALARVYNVQNARIARARTRLGFFTDVIGDEKMAEIVTSTPDPSARGAKMLTYKERQYTRAP